MAKVNNQEVYPLEVPLSKGDFAIGTQQSTGRTISMSVGEISKEVQKDIDMITAPIQKVNFNNESLPIEEHKIDLPSKLSVFENDAGFENTRDFQPFNYESLLTVKI